jgi:hypothetical protein
VHDRPDDAVVVTAAPGQDADQTARRGLLQLRTPYPVADDDEFALVTRRLAGHPPHPGQGLLADQLIQDQDHVSTVSRGSRQRDDTRAATQVRGRLGADTRVRGLNREKYWFGCHECPWNTVNFLTAEPDREKIGKEHIRHLELSWRNFGIHVHKQSP